MNALTRRGLALAAAALLGIPAAAQARDLWATDASGNLLRFDSLFPGDVLDQTPLTGLPAGVSLRGIDVRPATGELWGVGSDAALYRLDPATGAAAAAGPALAGGLSGAAFGVDFNPSVDRLRVVSDARQNLRANPNTGALVATDGALNPGTPSVVAAAYTASSLSTALPAATTLLVVDSAADQVVVQDPPNAGTLTRPLPLGVDVGPSTGFDIAGPRNEAFMVATPAGAQGASLFTVDLTTGKATAVGPVGSGRLALTGLAARQPVAGPLTVRIPPSVSIVRTTLTPRPGQRVAYIARALDPDGLVTSVGWDTDGDGAFDDATGFSARVPLGRGVSTIRVRVTDDTGMRATGQVRVRV